MPVANLHNATPQTPMTAGSAVPEETAADRLSRRCCWPPPLVSRARK